MEFCGLFFVLGSNLIILRIFYQTEDNKYNGEKKDICQST
jgi:hypothetical protein